MDVSTAVTLTIAVALLFAVINGFRDAVGSVATLVSTRVLTPRLAILWAACFNFVAIFVFHQGLAQAIAGLVHSEVRDPALVWIALCGLIGAIAWNLFTWWWELPSSSSHALIGGIAGAGIAYGGFDVLVRSKLMTVLYFVVLAPAIGFLIGSVLMLGLSWLFRKARPQRVDRGFRIAQLFSSAAYSIGHGGADAQKTIGVILVVMIAAGRLPGGAAEVPVWVVVSSYGCLAFGTAIGGWRLIRTKSMGLTDLRPVGGFAAEIAGAITLFTTASMNVPVSTTHTITGAIVGVGSSHRRRGIRWGVAGRIVWAWVFTIPAAAAVGAGCLVLARALGAW